MIKQCARLSTQRATALLVRLKIERKEEEAFFFFHVCDYERGEHFETKLARTDSPNTTAHYVSIARPMTIRHDSFTRANRIACFFLHARSLAQELFQKNPIDQSQFQTVLALSGGIRGTC